MLSNNVFTIVEDNYLIPLSPEDLAKADDEEKEIQKLDFKYGEPEHTWYK